MGPARRYQRIVDSKRSKRGKGGGLVQGCMEFSRGPWETEASWQTLRDPGMKDGVQRQGKATGIIPAFCTGGH